MFHDVRRAIESNDDDDIARMFDGSEYHLGKMEALEKTVDNLSHAFARLLLHVISTRSLTKSEATSIVSGSYDDTDGEY